MKSFFCDYCKTRIAHKKRKGFFVCWFCYLTEIQGRSIQEVKAMDWQGVNKK